MKTFVASVLLAVLLTPFVRAAEPQFAGIALDLKKPWAAKHDMTSQAYAAEFQKWGRDGFRLYCVTAYPKAGTVKFAAVWVKDGSGVLIKDGKWSPVGWDAFHDQTPEQYVKTFNDMKAKGLRPWHIAGYMVGGSHRLASIFANDGVTEWVAEHDQTEERHQQMLSEWQAKGYRPICTSAYRTESGTRFALVMEKNNKKYDWQARRNLTRAEYQQEFTKWTGQGYRPTQVCGYSQSGGSLPVGPRYSALFIKGGADVRASTRTGISETDYQAWIASLEKDKLVPVYVSAYVADGLVILPDPALIPLPMSGTKVPELTAYDGAMQTYMHTLPRRITAGTLAVMHNGKIVLSRGYGWLDSAEKRQCTPETPMRIASVSKPITVAAVAKLIRDGKLTAGTKVFSLLGTKPPAGQTMDRRLLNITVQHLLDHKGGWDSNASGDPMFKSLEIAKALGQTGPASANDIVRYMAGQPLDFDPGTKEAYSNFGYCVLGRVIENVSGKSYIDYVKSEIAPRAVRSIELGRTLPKDRNPFEPIYRSSEGTTTNVMEPGSNVKVQWPDGGFCLEAMDSHGGLVASAPDLVRFFQAYWVVDGSVRRGGSKDSIGFFGSLPGNFSFVSQRSDGVNFAVLFNQRGKTQDEYNDIATVLNKVTDGIKSWPK